MQKGAISVRSDQKGFTLAELLIVVAIIAVLVGVMVGLYGSSVERAREATDLSNIRSAFIEVLNNYLADGEVTEKTVDVCQRLDGWQSDPTPMLELDGVKFAIPVKTSGVYTVSIEVDPATEAISPRIS